MAQRGSRPFASYSGLGGRYFWRGSYFLQRASFVAGFLGESSFGGQMQSFFHKTFKGREGYEGWQDQVEGGVFALGEYSAGLQKNFFCRRVCLSVIPSGTFTLGNLVTSLSLGGTIAFGQKERASNDFLKSYSFLSGGSGFLAGKDFSWSLFTSFFWVDVFYNRLLEGETILSRIVPVAIRPHFFEFHFGGDLSYTGAFSKLSFVLRFNEYEGRDLYGFLRFGLGYRW